LDPTESVEGPKDFEVPKAPSPGRPTPYDSKAPPPLNEEARLNGIIP